MFLDPLTKGAGELIAADAFWGTAVVALAGIIVYLWRDLKLERNQRVVDIDEERERADKLVAEERNRHAAEMAEERRKHAVEIAEQRRLNEELQLARLNEVKTAFTEVTKALKTVELVYVHGGSK